LTRRHRAKLLLSASVLVVGVALFAAACGGGGGGGNEAEGTTSSETAAGGGSSEGKTFANFNLAYDTGTDFLDPGLSYTVQGWQIMWNVYLPLIGYKHVSGPDGATIVPYLAEDLPKVSADGKTYRLKLRKGLKYSDGSPVKASDFRATIERDFKIDSPGVGFFGGIVGADQFAKTKKGHISGITANDQTGDITIKLTAPQGDFQNILATTFAAPVPANTPAKDQSTHPIPSTGPYMIKSWKPNRQAIIVRNPNFAADAISDVPRGNPDRMTVNIIGDDSAALQSVIQGKNNWDFHPIPTDRLGEVQNKYGDQLKIYTPANTYYYFVNTRLKPFDNLKVRQAVNFAIDRQALVRLYGGLAAPTENVLPPTYPSYKKISLYPHNLAKAKQLIKQAGATGAAVTVWGSDRETSRKPAEYLQDVLNQIGLKAKLKIINASVYWTTIGTQSTKAQIGFADWFQDYPHPLDWFDVLLNGNRITDTHNNNYSNADVPAINNKIEELKKQPTLNDQVNQDWAQVDKMVAQQALWVPYVNRQFTDFFSSDMDLTGDCYVNHVLYALDFALVCKKSGG